jgi:hypothetical protein
MTPIAILLPCSGRLRIRSIHAGLGRLYLVVADECAFALGVLVMGGAVYGQKGRVDMLLARGILV